MIVNQNFQDKYVKHFAELVKNAKPVYGADAVLKAYNIDGDVRIQYRDQMDFEFIARQFGIFEEWKVIIWIWFSFLFPWCYLTLKFGFKFPF